MQALIEQLVKLQALELDCARVTREVRGLPGEIARAETALTAAEQKAAQASAALSREDTLRSRMDRDIEGHRQKAARFRAQLDAVKTPEQAAAIDHELQFAATEIERMESEEFASLERSEAQESEMAAARAQVELLSASLDTVRASIASRRQELEAELAALESDRGELRNGIAEEWLTRFDRLAGARGTGIARAENQQCTACRMGVRPQTWNQLREGQLLSCDSCSRLLYWDPKIAPEPKPPQPEPVPGQGRAVRKPGHAGA